jgi:RNA recognition motif-containing protein
MPRTELFVGNLGRDIERKDVEDVFEKYGRIVRCDLKNRGKDEILRPRKSQLTKNKIKYFSKDSDQHFVFSSSTKSVMQR